MIPKLLFLLLIPFLLIPVHAATDEQPIPSWIKLIAGAWVDGDVKDNEFKEAIEFLVEKDIIAIGIPHPVASTNNVYEEKLQELEIVQKDDMINTLQSELEETKSEHLQVVIDLEFYQQYSQELKENLDNARSEFDQYKKDYPLKVGNIGGEMVSAETIIRLTAEIGKLRDDYEQLADEYDELARNSQE